MINEKIDPITKGVNVPISLNRLKEPKIRGHAWFVIVVWAIYLLISIFVSIGLIYLHMPAIPSIIIPLTVSIMIGLLTARSRKQVISTVHKIYLLIRLTQKGSTFKKYEMSLDDIKKWIPIESVEKSGLIKYANGTSAIAVVLDPPRESADSIIYNTQIMNVINTLHGEFTYQFLTISSKESKEYLLNSTTSTLNEDLDKPILEQTYSIYDYAINTNKEYNVPEWKFLLFVGMPVSKSIEDAERTKDALISGLTVELERARILSNVVTGRTNCIILLRSILMGE